MQTIFFFKKKKSFNFSNLLSNSNSNNKKIIQNVRTLSKSKKLDLTFFDSIRYKTQASTTKASGCQ